MLRRLSCLAVLFVVGAVCIAVELDESAKEPPPIKLPSRAPAPEMKVLHNLVGVWKTSSINKVSAWNPEESRSAGTAVAKLILGGHVVLCKNAAHKAEPYGMTIFTYDPARGRYRSLVYDALGNAVESTGQWDSDTQTLSFIPIGRPGENRVTFRFLDNKTTEYTIQGKDVTGRTLIDVEGTWVRQSAEEKMSEPIEVVGEDVRQSKFAALNMSGTTFKGVDLSDAVFENINLRGARFSAIDFGGARFSCMNTGEDRPREPVVFENVELHDCTFNAGSFRGVKIIGAELEGMTIDGMPVEAMIKAYKKQQIAP